MSARGLLLTAGGIGLVAVLTQTSCLALLCYEDESCAGGSGGASTANATASETVSATDITGTGVTQGGGGAGGGPACDMSLLMADSKNCGECGHDCAGGECSSGVCQPFSIDIDPAQAPMGPIVVSQDHVFMVVDTADGVVIKVVPVSFDERTPIPSFPVGDDVNGKWGVGPERVYYAPQSVGGRIYACNTSLNCSTFDTGDSEHLSGSAAIDNRLYVIVSVANKIRAFLVDDGVPKPNTGEDVISMVDQPAGGLHEMWADPNKNLVFTTYGSGGCVYREDSNAFVSPASCDGAAPMSSSGFGALALDPQGTAYLATLGGYPAVKLVGGTLINVGGMKIRPPLGVDASFIYARSGDDENDGFVILDAGTGELVRKVSDLLPGAIDATDPDFVFFSLTGDEQDESRLYRLRKPVVPPG